MTRICSYIFNSRLKNIILTIVALISIINPVVYASYVFNGPESYGVRYGFYDMEECEVLLLGQSHMYNGIMPLELWKNYGISSYNLTYSGEHNAEIYYSLQDAIKVHKPKVVVMDMHGTSYGDEIIHGEYTPHRTFDAMRYDTPKIEGIRELISEEKQPWYLFPLVGYHERWMELSGSDFNKHGQASTLGGHAVISQYYNERVNDAFVLLDEDDYEYTDNAANLYLEKIVQLCQEEDIDICMIYIPHLANAGAQMMANQAKDLAEKYDNATYMSLLYHADEMNINYLTDLYDYSHLNASGAYKVTRYMGEYLRENYELGDYSESEWWIDTYQSYKASKDSSVDDYSTLAEYMLAMADEDYECSVYEPNSDWRQDKKMMVLVENAAEEGSVEFHDRSEYTLEGAPPNVDVITVTTDSRTMEIIDTAYWDIDGNRI